MGIDVIALRREHKGPYYLITTSDDQTLFLRVWEPAIQKRKDSAVLIFHGITAHSGPYAMVAGPLTQRGYTAYGLDLRGHGLSDGNRGDYPSKERLVKDLCETIAYVKGRHRKVVVLGHSLGVLSTIIALNNCLEMIDGAVLLSGARTVRHDAYPTISVAQKLKILFSSLLSPSRPVIRYEREGQVGLDDPLFTFRYTLRFMRILALRQMAFPKDMKIPVFVGVGDNDELFSVDDCKQLYDEVPSEVKEFYVAAGATHTQFPQGGWDPLAQWIERHFD